jgi:HK97 family phage prohead protease
MSETTDDTQITKREVGERVKLNLNFEPDSAKALGDGQFEAVITTSSMDRHNENIVTDGIETDTYMQNPVVLYGHDYFGLPIGKTTKLTKMKNKIKVVFQLAVQEYEFASTVAKMIESGYLNAVSIGGKVLEWSEDYKSILKMEMLEYSVVSIPANSEALITARSLEAATGKTLSTIEKEYHEFSHGKMLDKIKHMGDDEVEQSVKVLKTLVATLEESLSAPSSAGDAEPETVRRIKKVRLLEAAKAVNKESERTIRVVKLKA